MALTAHQAINHISHTLYEAQSDIPPIEVVNTAGKLLYSMRQWHFRNRGPAVLGFTAAQSYIELPSDFGSITGIEMSDASTTRIWRVTLPELLAYRTQNQGAPRDFFVAVSFVTPGMGTRVAPRLELYPTPTTTEAAAITFFYKARWVEVTDDDADLVGVPELAEPLYLRVCRQLARSYEDEDVTSYTEALGSLRASEEFRMAIQEDVSVQGSYGELANGIAYCDVNGYPSSSFWDRTLNAPS